MADIDHFLRSITRFEAEGAVFASNANVALRFHSGERQAVQKTPHDLLVRLVEEIAPSSSQARLRRNEPTEFTYELDARSYRVAVRPHEGMWRVDVKTVAAAEKPAPQAEPRPKAPPSSPSVRPIRDEPPSGNWKPIERLLLAAHKAGASDLHLCAGAAPNVRVDGEIRPLPGASALDGDTLISQLLEITPDKNRREFEERSDTDFAHTLPGVARFRANLFRDLHGPGAVFRSIPFTILSPEQLGLSPAVLDLCNLTKGLVVVTGPTGSGKSTTLATLVDRINRTRHDHIITIEDPIEFVHESRSCLVNQREVHSHTRSFRDALRAALREDPDVVLVGELRDLETVALAVETAETGHLVLATLHTTTAPSTVDRIIDQFPADRQEQIRQMLSESLRGVIAQTLCRRKGGGRVAAYEVLLGSGAVSNIIRERKTFQLFSLMQTARGQGMVTLNDSLIDLVRRRLVEPQEAYLKAVNKAELKSLLEREGFPLEQRAA